jgi:hypothetical protein
MTLVPVQKRKWKGMINATQKLHNLGQKSLARLAQPGTAATGTAVQAVQPSASIGKQIEMEK